MQKHILVVSQYFYPEQFRINDMCREWVKRGYRVTVLTGIPNYPQGKFFKGYNWFKRRREAWNGVDIIRIPLIARGHSSLGLVLNYLSFVFFGFFWAHFTALRADRVFNFEVSPMTQALIGVWFKKRRKIPCDIYVQDIWPDNVEIITGIHSRLVIGPLNRMTNYIYKNCERIFATSPSFVDIIKKRIPGHEGVFYWPQYAEEFYKPTDEKSRLVPDDGSFKIVFTGNIGQAQGLDILPRIAVKLKGENVKFVVVGDGRYKARLTDKIHELGVLDKFVMIPRQNAGDIPQILAACNKAFVSFKNESIFACTIPAKLQSYMACGMPVLAVAVGETRRVIDEAACGYCFGFDEVDAIAAYITDIANDPCRADKLAVQGQNALTYCAAHFDKKTLMDEMDAYINS